MKTSVRQKLVPQEEEGITQVEWMSESEVAESCEIRISQLLKYSENCKLAVSRV